MLLLCRNTSAALVAVVLYLDRNTYSVKWKARAMTVPTEIADSKSNSIESGLETALIRSLVAAKVEFVRYVALDLYNAIRCKVIPLKRIQESPSFVDFPVAMAKVCFAGLPTFQDSPDPDCGLDASGSLLMRPDFSTLRILPYSTKTAIVLCNLFDTETGTYSEFCTRSLLQRMVKKLQKERNMGVSVGTEIEFSLFDATTNEPVDRSNFAHPDILDMKESFLSDLCSTLEHMEIGVDMVHAESSHGQVEIVLKYQRDAVQLADHLVIAREAIKNISRRHGMKAIFLPKVFPDAAGNGCHLHMSLYEGSPTGETQVNLFSDIPTEHDATNPVMFSKLGQSFVEGILRGLPELLAITIPSVNSFERVGPGCWTGSTASWGIEDKEAAIRLVKNNRNGIIDRLEFKLNDHCANPYLSIHAIIASGMKGVEKNLALRSHSDSTRLPGTFEESLSRLEISPLPLFGNASDGLKRAYLAVRRSEATFFSSSMYSVNGLRRFTLNQTL